MAAYSYATPVELTTYAKVLDADAPADSDAELILEAASRDLDRIMGRRELPVDLLADEPRAALARATCAQALWRHEQGPDMLLGTDDGLASAAGLSFSMRPVPRISELAVEELAGWGLLARSGCALPDPEPMLLDDIPF